MSTLAENLARETLELHTLGVGGGYTQADVTSYAEVITGWSIGSKQGRHPEEEQQRSRLHRDLQVIGAEGTDGNGDGRSPAVPRRDARPESGSRET